MRGNICAGIYMRNRKREKEERAAQHCLDSHGTADVIIIWLVDGLNTLCKREKERERKRKRERERERERESSIWSFLCFAKKKDLASVHPFDEEKKIEACVRKKNTRRHFYCLVSIPLLFLTLRSSR